MMMMISALILCPIHFPVVEHYGLVSHLPFLLLLLLLVSCCAVMLLDALLLASLVCCWCCC
jgi:hypothetical protein